MRIVACQQAARIYFDAGTACDTHSESSAARPLKTPAGSVVKALKFRFLLKLTDKKPRAADGGREKAKCDHHIICRVAAVK